jgi:hypothetical protein
VRQYETQPVDLHRVQQRAALALELWSSWYPVVQELEVHVSMDLQRARHFKNIRSLTIFGDTDKMSRDYIFYDLEHLAMRIGKKVFYIMNPRLLKRLDLFINGETTESAMLSFAPCSNLAELNIMANDNTQLLTFAPLFALLERLGHLDKLILRRHMLCKSLGSFSKSIKASDAFNIINTLRLTELSVDLFHLRHIFNFAFDPDRALSPPPDAPELHLTLVEPTLASTWSEADNTVIVTLLRTLSQSYKITHWKLVYGSQTEIQRHTPLSNLMALFKYPQSCNDLKGVDTMLAWETVDDTIIRMMIEEDHWKVLSWQRTPQSSPNYREVQSYYVVHAANSIQAHFFGYPPEIKFWSAETILNDLVRYGAQKHRSALWD